MTKGGKFMKIYLLDKNEKMVESWNRFFKDDPSVKVVNNDFESFMKNNDVECVVSPANSFGLMDGGYDLAISNYFGDDLQKKVQKYIIKNFNGEQPVGTAFMLKIPNTNKRLIHAPTMRNPGLIKDPLVVYFAMRETLRIAEKNKVESIVIPAFGALTGGVHRDTVAKYMNVAFKEYNNKPEKGMSWKYASRRNDI